VASNIRGPHLGEGAAGREARGDGARRRLARRVAQVVQREPHGCLRRQRGLAQPHHLRAAQQRGRCHHRESATIGGRNEYCHWTVEGKSGFLRSATEMISQPGLMLAGWGADGSEDGPGDGAGEDGARAGEATGEATGAGETE